MKTRNRLLAVACCLLVLLGVVLASPLRIPFPGGEVVPEGESVIVYEVIDGDTIRIYTPVWLPNVREDDPNEPYRRTVRLIGIDTPERWQPSYQEAKDALEVMLPQGTPVILTQDTDDRDGHGRWLAYVSTALWEDVGAEMLRLGWAVSWRYPPNTARAEMYRELMAEAYKRGVGVFDPALEEPHVYVASDERDVYHRVGCGHAERIAPWNLVSVFRAQDLITAGKLQCRFCLPEDILD